jgi:hypothetical protein
VEGRRVAGWDVGGVNTKVAHVDRGRIVSVCGRPFELQRAPDSLVDVLRSLASEAGCGDDLPHAVTMTAELSQMFRTKREGVSFVLTAFDAAFPGAPKHVFAVDGRFLSTADADADPLAVAAANWSATAHLVAREHPDAVLIDIGTTTTDIIPIASGVVVARGRTDLERLESGELVYTGALRTPAEAIAGAIPLRGQTVGVSAEGFALAGDVHVWRGDLSPADYTVTAPDGRPATREFAGERLARVVCADREMLSEGDVTAIANALARAQVDRIVLALRRVVARHPLLETAVVTGLGAFLAEAAASAAGLRVIRLAGELGAAAAQFAPAAAVALLYASPEPRAASFEPRAPSREPRVDLVVKIGGSLLAQPGSLDGVLTAVATAARERRLLVVPGGGPFADAVRDADARFRLSDETSHWMAVLAMDQHAHLLAERLACGALVTSVQEIQARLDDGRVPVLAPSAWLRAADPLPHSWDVTSDSIAAWVAGVVGARRLVLVKPAGAKGDDLVDRHFDRALPPGVELSIVAADAMGGLQV